MNRPSAFAPLVLLASSLVLPLRAAGAQPDFDTRWDGKRWTCQNVMGKPGFNRFPLQAVLRTKSGLCADLNSASLDRADLSESYLRGASLSQASLRDANLEGAILSWADLTGARLEGAVLTEVKANGSSFRSAFLSGAVLKGANLEDADLRGADLSGAVLDQALLKGAVFDGDTKLPFDLVEAIGRGMTFVKP